MRRCPRTGTSGSLASCRAASLFSSPSAQICLPFVTALRPDRPTPSPSGWPNACGWASGGLPPALPSPWALSSPCGGRGPPPRYTSMASTGLVACAKYVSGAVQGRSSTAHRGLERNSLLLVSYRTLAPCFGRPCASKTRSVASLRRRQLSRDSSSHARAVAAYHRARGKTLTKTVSLSV